MSEQPNMTDLRRLVEKWRKQSDHLRAQGHRRGGRTGIAKAFVYAECAEDLESVVLLDELAVALSAAPRRRADG